MRNVEPRALGGRQRALIASHGGFETGKTYEIRRIIEAWGREQVYVISGERGLACVGDLNPQGIELLSEEDFTALAGSKFEDDMEAYAALVERALGNFALAYEWLRSHTSAYAWWCDDGISRIAAMIETKYVRQFEADGDNPNAGRRAYQKIAEKLSAVFTLLQMLPLNGYMNALSENVEETRLVIETMQYGPRAGQKRETREKTGRVTKQPALAGRKSTEEFPARWDAMLYFFTKRARLQGTNMTVKEFWADTQGDEATQWARLRATPSRPVPRFIRRGWLTPEGAHHFDPAVDWDVPRLWEALTGRKRGDRELDSGQGKC